MGNDDRRKRLRLPASFLLGALAAFGGAGVAANAEDTAPAPPPTSEQLARAKCVSGMEKFLPGAYFYCLGAQSYGQNQHRYADRFFKEAASWASKPAEYVLGVMALNGDGEPVNRPLALAWFALAAERQTPRFEQPYDALKSSMSTAELGKADDYLASLRKTYGDAVAAPRAERRYRDGVNQLPKTAAETNYCISGARDYGASTGAADAPEGGGSMGAAQACGTAEAVVRFVDSQAGDVFEGWSGHVSVGAIQPASAGGKVTQ